MKRWFKSLGHRRCWVAPCIMAVLVLLSAANMAFAATGDLYGDGTANARDEDCPDLDGLSPVGFIDFSILAYNWRLMEPYLLGDLNTDRIVDIDDLAILAAYWLSDCFIVSVPDVVDVVDMDPDSISVGEPTLVTITAHIDPAQDLIDSEVRLLRLDEHNQVIETLGYLHDDGLRGDAVAGDNVFTIQTTFTEQRPTQIRLQVAIGYDTPYAIFSDDIILFAEPEPGQLDVGRSFHLMTFNTQLLTSNILSEIGITPDMESEYGMDNEERAEAIAKAILNMNPLPDIIALQEVFDEDAKDEFEDELKGTYPHYVYKLDSDAFFDPDEDSGLMLFSRFHFDPLPNDQYKAGDVTAYTKRPYEELKEWDEVAFIDFDDCSWPDSLANKGVGFVRIRVWSPSYSQYINVAFAHTQASYGGDDYDDAWERAMDRRAQLDDIKKVIQGSLKDTHLENEPVFVMGDLNINGNPDSMDSHWIMSKTIWDNMKSTDDDGLCYNYEWDYHFNRYLGTSFFSTYFSDSWIYDTVETDPGQTTSGDFPDYLDDNPTQGERLDYILHHYCPVIS